MLSGTGIRNRTALAAAKVPVDRSVLPAIFAGAPAGNPVDPAASESLDIAVAWPRNPEVIEQADLLPDLDSHFRIGVDSHMGVGGQGAYMERSAAGQLADIDLIRH